MKGLAKGRSLWGITSEDEEEEVEEEAEEEDLFENFMGKKKEPAAPKWMWLVGIIAGFVALAISLIIGLVTILTIFLPFLFLGSIDTYGY